MIQKMTFFIDGKYCNVCLVNNNIKIVGNLDVSFKLHKYDFVNGTAISRVNGQVVTPILHINE